MPDPANRIVIDALCEPDLPQALAIQSACYPPFLLEDENAFASRITLGASCCLAARRGDALLGYLLAHGWPGQSPPPVGTILRDGGAGEVLHLHDLAVAPAARGLRLGEQLVDAAFALAAGLGLRQAELIAVEGAAPFWRRLGFAEAPVSPDLAAKVHGYGEEARWMVRAMVGAEG